jgi:apolipoprotein N-acyltransferase
MVTTAEEVAPPPGGEGASGSHPPDLAPPALASAPARRLPRKLAVPAAAGSGLALLLSFPPSDLWWLAPIGVALLAVAAHRQRLRAGAGLGLLAGLIFFVPLLSWTNLNTGNAPWLLLSVAEACFLGLLGAAAAWAGPLVDRARWSWPVLTAALWVGQEALRDRTPFGGFPWGRLAFSQDGSPLLRLAVLGGAPLVTFAVGLVGGLLAAAAWRLGGSLGRPRPVEGGGRRRGWLIAAGLLVAAVAITAASLAVPLSVPSGAPVTVAFVQGNVPRLGLEFNAQRRAVLDNHVNATLALAARVAAGQQARPDLVIWPENASDIDPLSNPDAAARIDLAAKAIGAPILVGTLQTAPDGKNVYNVGLVWQPSGGPDQTYAKRHPVPFAEYIPLRSIARMVSDKVDLVARDMIGGKTAGVLRMGPAVIGDVICFEVAYDDLVRDTVTGGGQLLTVQTNNATFNSAEARQQLAMVRLRAIEHGRDALMASTVGVSAFVGANGRVYDATRFNTQAVEVRQLHLGTGQTLATRLGEWPEIGFAGLAALALLAAAQLRRRERAQRRSATPDGQADARPAVVTRNTGPEEAARKEKP